MGIVAEQFAVRLRALRTEAFLTQEDLAKKAGISPGQIVRYEAGKNIPREAIQIALAEALGVSPLDFYTSDDTPVFVGNKQDSAMVAKRISERIHKFCRIHGNEPALLSTFASLDFDQWKRILKGEALPPANWVPIIAKSLGIRTLDLLGGVETEENKEDYIEIPFYYFPDDDQENQSPKLEIVRKKVLFPIKLVPLKKSKKYYIIRQTSDSMEPTFKIGDFVLVEHPVSNLLNDGLYVFKFGSHYLIKRVQVVPPGIANLTNDNPSYKDFQVEESGNTSPVGKVVLACKYF